MPGFIGGSSGGTSGTGGEITFPREFIDPVTKLRVSEPQALVDTDFEYGLQPTKWETVELINNTPSFFSKGGDTTIPNITSITTNTGTREITVNTLLDHGLSVGIPINVTGTKSVTADGAYIIASIPTTTSFTYLCRDNQPITQSIEDLYTSIITGEFFQGSQIRVSDSAGIITDGASTSTLTVTTDSAHGFKVDTPFYFLNLNSTISQEFQAANTTAKSFDSSNSATAQTFDGSNTLSSINIDWSNSATTGGVASSVQSVSTAADTITVTHSTENFSGRTLGTPLYYNVTAAAGYFNTNPRGVVFINSVGSLGTSTSTFTVSDVPGGTNIDLTVAFTGTFQLANQARTFAGNNLNPDTQLTLTLFKDAAQTFDATNAAGKVVTITNYGSPNIAQLTNNAGTTDALNWAVGTMVRYTTSGSAATGLAANTTYWVKTIQVPAPTAPGLANITLTATPGGAAIGSISGGTGTQTLTQTGVSIDKDYFCIPNHGYTVGDMLKYNYPASGNFGADSAQNFYYVETVPDTFNFTLTTTKGGTPPMDGSTALRAAPSATYLLTTFGAVSKPTGYYWIKPTGYSGSAKLLYCDMTTAGGGWMLGGWLFPGFLQHTYVGDADTWSDTGGSSNGGVAALGQIPTTNSSATIGRAMIDHMVNTYKTRGLVLAWTLTNPTQTFYFNPNANARWGAEDASDGTGRNGWHAANRTGAGNAWLQNCNTSYTTSGQNGAGTASGGTSISYGGADTWGVFPFNMAVNFGGNWGSAINGSFADFGNKVATRNNWPAAHNSGWGQGAAYWFKLSNEA
jgi:hypothetical protein